MIHFSGEIFYLKFMPLLTQSSFHLCGGLYFHHMMQQHVAAQLCYTSEHLDNCKTGKECSITWDKYLHQVFLSK